MDHARVESIYEAHGVRVLRYCLFRTGRLVDAEDAAAETFARLLARGDGLPEEAIAAWLLKVAGRVCVDRWRRSAREEPVADPPETGSESEHWDGWSDPRVPRALATLTRRQQQVVYLRAIEGLPFAEIASLAKRSEPAVRMAYHRAMTSLARKLEGARDAAEG